MNWTIFIILQDMASTQNNQKEAKLLFLWPLSTPRMLALHWGFGARGTNGFC